MNHYMNCTDGAQQLGVGVGAPAKRDACLEYTCSEQNAIKCLIIVIVVSTTGSILLCCWYCIITIININITINSY